MNKIIILFTMILLLSMQTIGQQCQNALDFNGSNQAVTTSGNGGVVQDNFTMEFWANPSATTTIGLPSTSGYYGLTGIQRYAISPDWGGYFNAGAGVTVGTNGVCVIEHADNYIPALLVWSGTLTGWHHIAVVYTSKQPSLYIDGVWVATGLTSPRAHVYPSLTSFGGFVYGHYSGTLDEIRIWNVSRTAAQIAANYNSTVSMPNASVFGYYKFNEGSGNGTADASANAFNGTLINSPAWTAGYQFPGSALHLDGTNDWVQIPFNSAFNSQTFTVEGWVKPTSGMNAWARLWGTQNNKHDLVVKTSGTEAFSFWPVINNSFVSAVAPFNWVSGQWYHIAGVVDGSYVRLYVNGVQVAATPYSGTVASDNGVRYIGRSYSASEIFRGTFDEVRFWNRPLCQAEIQNNMNCEIPAAGAGLVTNYHFNQGVADGNNTGITILNDASGNTNNGALINFALTCATSNWVSPGAVVTGTSCGVFIDSEPPVPNVSPLATVTGECSASVTSAPTATDNCAGSVTGTTTDPLTYSALGTYTINWTYDDGNGNTSNQTQTVIVYDITAPVFSGVPSDATVQCNSIPPAASVTANDNCADALAVNYWQSPSAAVTAKLSHLWKADGDYTDAIGSANGSPVGAVSFGSPVLGSNGFSFNGAPGYINTGTAGSVSGTGDFAISAWIKTTSTSPMVIIQQRDTKIDGEYMFKIGGNHNNGVLRPGKLYFLVYGSGSPVVDLFSSVSVNDGKWHYVVAERNGSAIRLYADGALVASGSTVVAVNMDGTIKTTIGRDIRDNNSNFNGLIDDVRVWTAADCPSTYGIDRIWTAQDNASNLSAAVQHINVEDTQAPTLTGVFPSGNTGMNLCKSAAPAGPSASDIAALFADNCGTVHADKSGSVTGNNDSWSVTYTYDVYDDCNNHVSPSPTITYSGGDQTAPVPDLTALATVTGECSAEVTTVPTATDNCEGAITGTTTDPTSYSAQGTYTITWTYDDGNGNTSSQTQTVIIDDVTAPVADVSSLPTVTAECSASVTAPTATDNCVGSVTGTTTDPTSYSAQGTYTITWTYDDGNGNTSFQTQTVIINDVTDPVAVCKSFTLNLTGGTGTVTAENVNNGSSDNCGIASMSVSPNTFTCADAGQKTVTLTVTDFNGNSSSCDAVVTVQYQPSCSIVAVPANNTYTGGNPNVIYIGYGSQSVTLSSTVTGGSGFTYSWSGLSTNMLSCTNCANPVFTPNSEGRYQFMLTATNSNGCSTTCSIEICVLDVRVPGSNNKVYLCHYPPGNTNNPQTLSISVNAVPAHIPAHVGDHLGKCSQSCENLAYKMGGDEGELIVTEGVSFETVVFPNPFSSDFTVTVETESMESIHLYIYDLTGKMLQEVKDVTPNTQVKVSNDLKDGFYLLRVHQGDQVQNIKIIKRR